MSRYDELVSIYLKAKDEHENDEGFWENSFWLMIVPNFPSSIAVKKSDGHFIVKFESDDTQFIIKDIKSENLESFYHFVFERWKEKLANYFQARPAADEKRESGQY